MAADGRRGGREARRAVRTSVAVRSLPALQRQLPLYEVLSPEWLERIHETALHLLETVGIDFREDEALAKWRDAGATVGHTDSATGDRNTHPGDVHAYPGVDQHAWPDRHNQANQHAQAHGDINHQPVGWGRRIRRRSFFHCQKQCRV